ncbi:LptF/LptG family permease [Polaromonas sp. P1-6]|nr:LptF/LptG family permease [Polaromonas sp. P1-6]
MGKNNGLASAADIYQIRHALLYVALLIPNHLYELLPISVLIGTIFVMARLAQSSEYTILRTSGLGPWRAADCCWHSVPYLWCSVLRWETMWPPPAERAAQLLKARYQSKITVGQTGAWLKEKQAYNTYVVNVKTLTPDNEMQGVQIFEFNNKGLVVSTTQAPIAAFAKDDAWQLKQATRGSLMSLRAPPSSPRPVRVSPQRLPKSAGPRWRVFAGRPGSALKWCLWRCSNLNA